ncbi:glycoside hydrolase family 3 [Desulfosarcina alkanivorans]|jgi:beta-N-acetylhexosaminidase|uniref:beta-N-acetylhexosaminidase n=1 Tax=Desulfosarcina alkanivorans TaxID=571177 RepID=A0A5K7YYJ9_9BACT|nr:glycoside hydrolase family 3 N-terminal domain-containing protein [Desulfosarcina alkanivorans]BBO72231.1 glycoside hydrolase family 3 [Desulfosarcina alkanivorans]
MHPSESNFLAGQRLMVGFDGTDFNDDLEFLIGTLQVGGLILFSRNVDTPDQIRHLCRDCQSFAASCGLPPLFIAIDQEGGQVARLRAPFTQFPGNPAMTHPDDAAHFARVTAGELTGVGINMDMAPVLDVAPEGVESVMAGRAFGSDPGWVAAMGATMIDHFQRRGIMAVAKHFPGIGRTVLDSHLALPDLDIDAKTLADSDLVPFQAAIHGRVAGIMLSHIRYAGIDPVWPASLSPAVTADLLRGRMGYQGVVMTDDLDMGAIKPNLTIDTTIGQIMIADVDIALICHKGPDIQAACEKIRKALVADRGLRRMGVRSVERILRLKRRFLAGPWALKYENPRG